MEFISKYGKQLTFNKETAIENTINWMLTKTANMFVYENLPDTIPARILEGMLQELGKVIITKHDGELYVYDASPYGKLNEYYEHTTFLVHNPYQNKRAAVTLDKDAIIIRNDTYMLGIIPLIAKYASFKAESDITIHNMMVLNRVHNVLSVNDSDDAKAVDLLYKALERGDLKSLQLDNLFSEVNTHELGTPSNSNQYSGIIEMDKYLKAELMNTLGMPENDNMKSSYISDKETDLQHQGSMYQVLSMLEERRQGIERMNKLYDTNVTVKLNPEWFGTIEEIKEELEEQMEEAEPLDTMEDKKETIIDKVKNKVKPAS